MDPLALFRCYSPVHFDPQGHLGEKRGPWLVSTCTGCRGGMVAEPHITAIMYHFSDYRPRNLEGKAKRADQARDEGGPGRLKNGLDVSLNSPVELRPASGDMRLSSLRQVNIFQGVRVSTSPGSRRVLVGSIQVLLAPLDVHCNGPKRPSKSICLLTCRVVTTPPVPHLNRFLFESKK